VATASIALLVFFVVHEPPQRGMMSPTGPSSPSSLEELSSAQQTQAEQEQREQKTVEKLSRQPVRVAREAEQRQAAKPQQRQAEQEHRRRSARTAPAEIERRVAEKLRQAGLPPKMVDEVSLDGIVTLHEWTSIALNWQQDDLNRLVLQVPGVTGVRWKQSAKPSSEIARPSGETGKSDRSESAQSP
jgi:hypothetical protein